MIATAAAPDSDALSASGRFKPYTLDGSTDIDLIAEGGGSCRRIKLLAAATGSLTLRQASPFEDASRDTAIVLDNLPAGDVIDVQATRIVGGLPNLLKILVLWCFAFALALGALGCATARDAAVQTLNASADFAKVAEPALEDLDRRDQQAVIDATKTREDAAAGVAAVRARYRAAWASYRDYRAAWLVAAASLRTHDDAERAKLTKSGADFAKAVADLVAAEGALAQAVTIVRQGGGH